MKLFTAALVALGLAAAQAERSYTDDLGVVHTTDIEKPTIVTFAHSAVSLFDYGMNQTKVSRTMVQRTLSEFLTNFSFSFVLSNL
jgi:hypothetical protein